MPAKWKQWWYWGAVMVLISLGPGPNRGEVVAVQKSGAVVVAGVAAQNDIGLSLISSEKTIRTDLGGEGICLRHCPSA